MRLLLPKTDLSRTLPPHPLIRYESSLWHPSHTMMLEVRSLILTIFLPPNGVWQPLHKVKYPHHPLNKVHHPHHPPKAVKYPHHPPNAVKYPHHPPSAIKHPHHPPKHPHHPPNAVKHFFHPSSRIQHRPHPTSPLNGVSRAPRLPNLHHTLVQRQHQYPPCGKNPLDKEPNQPPVHDESRQTLNSQNLIRCHDIAHDSSKNESACAQHEGVASAAIKTRQDVSQSFASVCTATTLCIPASIRYEPQYLSVSVFLLSEFEFLADLATIISTAQICNSFFFFSRYWKPTSLRLLGGF